ncbi:MAG: ATP-binding cassette domain-containing protein [Muribaculaceae bacterium]|nr:ATP-binding cassette domain-containing protein [Muribaculaceae bacterium]MDE7141427.1 ATP-binding cassette domain-containing protein [Muribaculaceae bacterium]
MESITLERVLPDVFAECAEAHSGSDVWLSELSFRRGGRYLVQAASGAGKSSLCAFIYGFRQDYTGRILFNSTDIRSITPSGWDAARQRVIAWLPQDMRLFPTLTALENIMLKVSLTHFKTEAEVMAMLEEVGMERFADRPARLLSIGQQQRVAAVRAVCQPFAFLLLDEPVSHLDDVSNRAVSSLIEAEASRQGAAIITTSVGNNPYITQEITLSL